MPPKVSRRVRKGVFGRDPEAYHRARLPYPKRVYEILTTRCSLRPGTSVFEIGPGTGIATRELLRLGADPITLIEPDRRLVRYLDGALGGAVGRVDFSPGSFEHSTLPAHSFDLGVAATSFHWLPERLALRKIARALRPGGWWATWNSYHGDPFRPGRFHRALQPLYQELTPGRKKPRGPVDAKASAARYRRNRIIALRSVGKFDRISREEIRWSVTLGTERVKALWGSFSEIVTLPPWTRERFLRELGRIAEEQFEGEVDLPVLTSIYTARRV
jgi:SAM-dependent methyltransferase